MDFQIRHSDARLLKPVIYALNRTCKEVHVSPGTDGIRFMGVSSDNSAGLTITAPASAFDEYRTDGTGAFRVSAELLYDAFRETKKTSSVGLHVEDIEFEDRRDYHSIGTDHRRVLDDKAIGVEDLDTAEPSDLIGETTYDTSVGDGEAEIDRQKAEEILAEHNGGQFVVRSGGERVDVDTQARVLHPGETPEEPPKETAADVGVNGRDFSKAVRALDSVTDHAYVGSRGGSLVLYGEGDTDEVWATPDSDVTGGSGGLYSVDLLTNLRMSLDKKASTRLTLSLPDATYGEVDHDESVPHILWAEFGIEEADVTYYAAPRVVNSDAESVGDVMDRVDPTVYDPVENARLSAASQGGDLKAWFKTVGAKVDEYRLSVNSDGLYTKAVDPANVGMVEMDLEAGAFDTYDWSQPAGRLYKQDGVVGVNNVRLLQMLKLTTKTEDVSLHVTATDNTVSLAVDTEHFTASMATIDPDSVRQEPDFPGLDMPGRVSVPVDHMTDAVDQTDDVADHTGIIIYDGELFAAAEGDVEDVWIPFDTKSGEGYAASLFSNDYLGTQLDAIPRGYDDAVLDLYTGREFPVVMETSVGPPEAEFSFMIAPRINSEENQIPAQDLVKENGLDPLRIEDAQGLFTINEDGSEVVRSNETDEEPVDDPDPEPDASAEANYTPPDPSPEDNPNEEADVYDPTDEWGPTMDTPIPQEEQVNIGGYDKRELMGTGLTPHDFNPVRGGGTDGSIHPDDADRPEEVDQFKEMAGNIYDPTDEGDVSEREFRVGPRGVGVPEEIGDFFLVNQAKNGRPLYRNRANKNQLRINRGYETDVVHRRYYVEFREDHSKTGHDAGTEHLGSGLSPTGAMELLEEHARELSSGTDDEPSGTQPTAGNTPDVADVDGTPLTELPGVDQATAEAMKDTYNVGTVEQFHANADAASQALRQEHRQEAVEAAARTVGDADDTGGVYDPTDEFDELEEPSEISAIGSGRRKTLDALDEKGTLDDPQSFDTLEEMKNAVREISLAHRDGRTYMAPPERALSAIQSTWDALPEDARPAFLNDHRLYVKIRAARNRFNDWTGKKRREQEIPSTMEAGPSNYPSKKAKKTAQYARDGKEELTEAIDKIRSAANGAKQRALKSVGTSVGEQNEQKREEKREERRSVFQKGDLAFYSTTSYGNALWGVKRVNEKSVRLRRPHGSAGMDVPMSDDKTYPEYDETRADLESNRLKGPIPAEKIAEFDVEDTDARMSEDAIAVRADTADEARRIVFGEEWVEDNLDTRPDPDDGTPAEDQPWLDELDGIGSATYDDLTARGLSNIGDAKEAYRNRAVDDTWYETITSMPSEKARRSLINAVGGDPDRSIADDHDAAMLDHARQNELEGEPAVGNYVTLNFPGGGSTAGSVTRVEDGEAMVRVNQDSEPQRWDYEDGRVETGTGWEEVAVAELDYEDHDVLADETEPGPGPGIDVADEDDLSDALVARGINRITANHLADDHTNMADVEDSVAATDDVTTLKGVSDNSAGQVRKVFDVDAPADEPADVPDTLDDDDQDVPAAVEEAGTLPGGFEYDGEYPAPPMADDTAAIDGPLYSWKRDSNSMVGVYENDEYADDGYPYTAAKYVNPKGDNPFWKHTHIAETWTDAVDAAKNTADYRTFIVDSEPGELYNEWEERTGGTSYEHPVSVPWEETDGEDRTEHEEAVEEAKDTDESEGLPQGALSALKKNWGVYKQGLKEGREAAEEVEEYQDVRKDAVESAAIINDIRAAHGQGPIDFDGVPAIPGADEIGGPITKDDPGINLEFSWSADPYDPTEEV